VQQLLADIQRCCAGASAAMSFRILAISLITEPIAPVVRMISSVSDREKQVSFAAFRPITTGHAAPWMLADCACDSGL
jgi:hypothetical protein